MEDFKKPCYVDDETTECIEGTDNDCAFLRGKTTWKTCQWGRRIYLKKLKAAVEAALRELGRAAEKYILEKIPSGKFHRSTMELLCEKLQIARARLAAAKGE